MDSNSVEIRELQKRDHRRAVQFAIKGMHFDWYLDSRFLLNLYGRYFWYLEITRATQVIAAYAGNDLAGVLLAEVKGERKRYASPWKSAYVRFFDLLQSAFFRGGVNAYDEANRELYARYCQAHSPDGELIFLAADPAAGTKGIGTLLLREFERKERGKEIYLYTDDACTCPFYEHRGFERSCEKDIVLELGRKKVPLKCCFLYSKKIP